MAGFVIVAIGSLCIVRERERERETNYFLELIRVIGLVMLFTSFVLSMKHNLLFLLRMNSCRNHIYDANL